MKLNTVEPSRSTERPSCSAGRPVRKSPGRLIGLENIGACLQETIRILRPPVDPHLVVQVGAGGAAGGAHAADPLAQLEVETEDFVWLTGELMAIAARHAGGRLVSVLEGGYDLEVLAESAATHVQALMRA